MPKRTDIKTVLIIGAGPIVIGQACEFDYSGAQACKALREEGYRVVLVNSNPATIMTDPEMADATYIEPVNWRMLEKIIAADAPTGIGRMYGPMRPLTNAIGNMAAMTANVARIVGLPTSSTASIAISTSGRPSFSGSP